MDIGEKNMDMGKNWAAYGRFIHSKEHDLSKISYDAIIILDQDFKVESYMLRKASSLGQLEGELKEAQLITIWPEIEILENTEKNCIQMGFHIKNAKFNLLCNYIPIQTKDPTKDPIIGAALIITDLDKKLLPSYGQQLTELSCAFDTSADGLVTVNEHGILTRMNKAYQAMMNVKAEDYVGKPVQYLKETEVLPDTVSAYVLKNREAKTMLIEMRGRDMLLTGTPVFGIDNEFIGVISNVRDMTELNRSRAEIDCLRDSNARYLTELEVLRAKKLNISVVARSPKMKEVMEIAGKAARFDSHVLITGETGTGKEVIASVIQRSSFRSKGPFISINCGAIPSTLLESELFGYEPGAFSGAATNGKPGLLETANNGTLLLDEIGELGIDLQVKLLRVLQDKSVVRIGGRKPIKLDVRIIAATNRDLEAMVKDGEFRSDLYYRLNVIRIYIPPLRERKEDIPPLAQLFLTAFNRRYDVHKRLTDKCIESLVNYNWPGNVRELENVIERGIVLTSDDIITDEVLQYIGLVNESNETIAGKKLQQILEDTEKKIIIGTYRKHPSTRRVASLLGISQPTVVRKLKKYGYSTMLQH